MSQLSAESQPRRRAEGAPRWRPGPPLIAISRRHSRFVGTMKLVLPAIGAALIAVVLAWPGAFERDRPLELPLAETSSGPADALAMLNPRYVGADADGQPFMITAERAVQDPKDLRHITLDTLQADMSLKDGTWLSLMARGGVYHQGRQTLQLQGPVNVYSDLGYEFHTGDIAVDLNRGTAVTEAPVNGHGPFGQLKADRMRIAQRGRHLIFTDHVSVTLHARPER